LGAEARIKELNISLPAPATPVANYVKSVQVGNLLFISGHGPGASAPRGKLGRDLTIEQGYEVAREVGIAILASVKAAIGDLDKVKRVVKVLGMVNSDPEFGDQPKVMNGCSDLFVDVFGDKGRHTRSAVGFVALPDQIPVEIEATFEVE
jgi:enamine deaminase RidA (YjgF/YER057c/UK114 family)